MLTEDICCEKESDGVKHTIQKKKKYFNINIYANKIKY